MHYGTFGPQGNGSFGFSPNYRYSAGRQGFGGYGGYGPQGVYKAGAAAAWGNPSSLNARAFNPITGYGGYYGPAQYPSPVMTTQSPVQEQQQQSFEPVQQSQPGALELVQSFAAA